LPPGTTSKSVSVLAIAVDSMAIFFPL